MNDRALLLVIIIALVTALLRFLPFIIFKDSKKTPKIITNLGKTLPYAVMAMLVVYCLKDVKFSNVNLFVPQIIAVFIVSISYIWNNVNIDVSRQSLQSVEKRKKQTHIILKAYCVGIILGKIFGKEQYVYTAIVAICFVAFLIRINKKGENCNG